MPVPMPAWADSAFWIGESSETKIHTDLTSGEAEGSHCVSPLLDILEDPGGLSG